jgi:hypothetical protein
MSARQSFRAEAGFTIAEMLIACAIMLTVTGAVFSLLNPSEGVYKAQPEVSDMQQRMRVGVDTLTKDLMMAGAGTYTGTSAGALVNFFAPIMPYRLGSPVNDPSAGIYFRPDAISLYYVPPTPSQTTISDAMPQPSRELKVNPQANCPKNKQEALCGFKEGMRAIIFDPGGEWDAITLTNVQDPALHLQFDGTLSTSYAAGSWITQLATQTYYLNTDVATNTYQLMYFDGYRAPLPLVDNVVKLEFKYFGEPQPPALIPGKSLSDLVGPFTTYGPKPPVIGVDNTRDTWPAGENCAFMVQNGQQVSRLPALAAGNGQMELTSAMLTDGPWCPDDTRPNRFDVDLLRIRRVRVKLRVQVAPASMRGPAGVLFTRGGTANAGERYVPDQEVSFDVTPRNLNLGR